MTEIPDYRLAECISRTNLSEVWRGFHLVGGAEVAVKFALSPAAAATLRPEAETVRVLEAAGVAGIVSAEYRALPEPHLVFPWKGRRTFRDVLDAVTSGDERARAARLLLDVAAIVADVHRRGFLHGDLKPENILVDDGGRPWLTDFGMARAVHDARLSASVSDSMDEKEGAWGGTLHYLPPEGLQGEPPAAAWDVYALGVMLSEVLLGKRPDRAASPESLKALLPHDIVEVLLSALAYDPADRFPNVPSLTTALEPISEELTLTGAARWAGRAKRLALAGLASFFVALRYVSVAALLAGYAAVAVATVTWSPSVLLAYVPFALLHAVVRWEGPETEEEVAMRRMAQPLGGRYVKKSDRIVARSREGEAP